MPTLPAPDITTIAACSTALAAIMCIAVLLSWVKDGLPAQRRWQFAPFGLAVPAGVLLTWPELLPGAWGLHLGWFLLTLVYGSAWLAARVTAGRPARPLAALVPCLAVLLFTCTIAADGPAADWRMLPRVLLFAAFNGLAAREIARLRAPQLPSATVLFWAFAIFCALDLARSPLSLSLPAPFGPRETEVWSIALFNFQVALEGLLLGVSLIALGREQVTARHYRLAYADPLTGIGNRRALDRRIAAIDPSRTALAVFDIDRFKSVNDAFGHDFGDLVIVGAAAVACEIFGEDNVFRTGGEEFAAIIAADSRKAALARCEAMRLAFADRTHVADGRQRRCTISIGLTLTMADQPAATLKAADRALYDAKRGGRNRTIVAGSGAPIPLRPRSAAHPPRAALARA